MRLGITARRFLTGNAVLFKDSFSCLCSFAFSRFYVQTELLGMLDAVIIYKGAKEEYKGNLMLLYEHLYCLVKLAYRLC